MAKCDLSIELADPDRVRSGGQTIQGCVNVTADADVYCKGLQVRTIWETHGRGNVASGESQTKVLYQGDWRAGQTYHYPFELIAARWPPTYHGHYLNVDHYVDARADIPWSFDPKAKQAFPVAAVHGPEDFKGKPVTESTGCASQSVRLAVGGIFFAIIAMLLINPFFWVLGALIGMGTAGWWFVFRWLPKYRLGPVKYWLETERFVPGESLRGTVVVHPPRDVAVNAITWTVTAVETCVSGSGTNRTTHRHTVLDQTHEIMPTGILRGGRESRFPLQMELPHRPIYSLNLQDNGLVWTATLRIDLPRWPDWKNSQTFQVVPAVAGSMAAVSTQQVEAHAPAAMPAEAFFESPVVAPLAAPSAQAAGSAEPPITFAETMQYFWEARENDSQIEQLLEAVKDLPMPFRAVIERRLLYGSDGPSAYQDGYVVWAHFTDPPTPLTLHIPQHLADDFERLDGNQWQGRGEITGYDRRHRRVTIDVQA